MTLLPGFEPGPEETYSPGEFREETTPMDQSQIDNAFF